MAAERADAPRHAPLPPKPGHNPARDEIPVEIRSPFRGSPDLTLVTAAGNRKITLATPAVVELYYSLADAKITDPQHDTLTGDELPGATEGNFGHRLLYLRKKLGSAIETEGLGTDRLVRLAAEVVYEGEPPGTTEPPVSQPQQVREGPAALMRKIHAAAVKKRDAAPTPAEEAVPDVEAVPAKPSLRVLRGKGFALVDVEFGTHKKSATFRGELSLPVLDFLLGHPDQELLSNQIEDAAAPQKDFSRVSSQVDHLKNVLEDGLPTDSVIVSRAKRHNSSHTLTADVSYYAPEDLTPGDHPYQRLNNSTETTSIVWITGTNSVLELPRMLAETLLRIPTGENQAQTIAELLDAIPRQENEVALPDDTIRTYIRRINLATRNKGPQIIKKKEWKGEGWDVRYYFEPVPARAAENQPDTHQAADASFYTRSLYRDTHLPQPGIIVHASLDANDPVSVPLVGEFPPEPAETEAGFTTRTFELSAPDEPEASGPVLLIDRESQTIRVTVGDHTHTTSRIKNPTTWTIIDDLVEHAGEVVNREDLSARTELQPATVAHSVANLKNKLRGDLHRDIKILRYVYNEDKDIIGYSIPDTVTITYPEAEMPARATRVPAKPHIEGEAIPLAGILPLFEGEKQTGVEPDKPVNEMVIDTGKRRVSMLWEGEEYFKVLTAAQTTLLTVLAEHTGTTQSLSELREEAVEAGLSGRLFADTLSKLRESLLIRGAMTDVVLAVERNPETHIPAAIGLKMDKVTIKTPNRPDTVYTVSSPGGEKEAPAKQEPAGTPITLLIDRDSYAITVITQDHIHTTTPFQSEKTQTILTDLIAHHGEIVTQEQLVERTGFAPKSISHSLGNLKTKLEAGLHHTIHVLEYTYDGNRIVGYILPAYVGIAEPAKNKAPKPQEPDSSFVTRYVQTVPGGRISDLPNADGYAHIPLAGILPVYDREIPVNTLGTEKAPGLPDILVDIDGDRIVLKLTHEGSTRVTSFGGEGGKWLIRNMVRGQVDSRTLREGFPGPLGSYNAALNRLKTTVEQDLTPGTIINISYWHGGVGVGRLATYKLAATISYSEQYAASPYFLPPLDGRPRIIDASGSAYRDELPPAAERPAIVVGRFAVSGGGELPVTDKRAIDILALFSEPDARINQYRIAEVLGVDKNADIAQFVEGAIRQLEGTNLRLIFKYGARSGYGLFTASGEPASLTLIPDEKAVAKQNTQVPQEKPAAVTVGPLESGPDEPVRVPTPPITEKEKTDIKGVIEAAEGIAVPLSELRDTLWPEKAGTAIDPADSLRLVRIVNRVRYDMRGDEGDQIITRPAERELPFAYFMGDPTLQVQIFPHEEASGETPETNGVEEKNGLPNVRIITFPSDQGPYLEIESYAGSKASHTSLLDEPVTVTLFSFLGRQANRPIEEPLLEALLESHISQNPGTKLAEYIARMQRRVEGEIPGGIISIGRTPEGVTTYELKAHVTFYNGNPYTGKIQKESE